MKKKIQKIINQIESGKRKNLYDVNFSLEEYFTDVNGITFLEYLLKNKIETNYTDIKKFKNSIEAAYLYVKYDEFYFGFELDEDDLFSFYEGERYIEFFLRKNKYAHEISKSVKEHIEVVDLLINSSKIYLLSNLSDEIIEKLMIKDNSGNYPIEKYLDNQMVIKELIKKVKEPIKLIELCNKVKRPELLKFVNEDVLMYKIDEKTSLLEDLLNKGMEPNILNDIPPNKKFINYLIEKELYEYLSNVNVNEQILLVKLSDEKTLLELLIEKNIIPNLKFSVFDKKIIQILYKKGMLNLISDCYDKILLTNVNEIIENEPNLNNTSFLEYMLERGYNPLSNVYSINNEELIQIYYNKGYYQFLGKKTDSDLLLKKLSDGKILIDVLLEKECNIDFKYNGFNEEIAKKLYLNKRYDLLSKGDLNVLLKNIDGESTYLDCILDAIKEKKIKHNLNKISFYGCSVNSIAKFYLAVAKKSMINYLENLNEEDLLREFDEKMLIEELLDLDSELTLNTIINDSVKSNMKIAVILKSRGLETKTIGVPLVEDNYTNDYLTKHQNTLGIGPLFNEGEILLQKLFELFASDGKSDISLVEALISGYRIALFINYNLSIMELKNLIEVKEKNKERFVYIKDEKSAYFSHNKGDIHCNSPVIETILHETGHALHFYLANNNIPEEYNLIIEKARNNAETLQNVEKFANIYNDMKKRMKEIAEQKYSEFFDSQFNLEYINSIEQFIKKSQMEKREEFETLGIDNETLDIILNNIFTSEEYIAHQKEIFIEEYRDHMMRSEFGSLMAIGDIIDAIYEGELNSGVLKNEKGEKINRTAGHGISYYCDSKHGFDEMVANFSSISKSNDSKEMLDLLKTIVGEELFNMLSEFYYTNIVNLNINEKDETKNL